MNTPLLDFLKCYQESGTARLHMPGHKGRAQLGPEPLDITEIRGADELYAAEGVIAQAEANTARAFGTAVTCWSTEGSSHAIRSMILLAMQKFGHPGGTILAGRNAHKAFLYALALTGCEAAWIYPAEEDENSVASCMVTPAALTAALSACREKGRMPFAVYVTSPDYLGHAADIAGLSAAAAAFGLPLLVDGAHGAYLHFLKTPCHPMDLGAAMCCDSAHKTLPVLTGGAYLHIREGIAAAEEVKAAMEVTGTTSPSYLIMASLDRAAGLLLSDYPEKIRETAARLEAWRMDMRARGIPVLQTDPLKLTVDAGAMGYSGEELGDLLRTHGAEPEFCDAAYLVCMLTPENDGRDLDCLTRTLLEAAAQHRAVKSALRLRLTPARQVMPVREAVLARHERVPLAEAEGRVCGAPTVSCPPAIPIAVSGELLTRETLEIMKAYGIDRVSVVIA